jgi:CubicO group peptidase (beta-lactamase class C family)
MITIYIYEIIKEFLIPDGKCYNSECWLNTKPGETTVYSSFGFIVLSYIVEQITSTSIEDYCENYIFKPLDMKNTFFHPCINNIDNIAFPYLRIFRIYIPLPHYDPKCLCSMGGIHTTLVDLSHFLIALMNEGKYNNSNILKESTVYEMINGKYPEEVFPNYFPHTYGLGIWFTEKFGEKLIGHGGGAPGYLCDMYMNNTSKRGFIMFSNHCNPGSPAYTINCIRTYPKIHMIRTKLGEIIINKINNN